MTTLADLNVDENIVRKIQLLFNLAASTHGNEVEAAAAMGKAQELLAKYNLDLQTVQDAVVKGGTNQAKQVDEKRGYAKVSRSAMYEWQRELVAQIADSNFCVCWITTEYEQYNTRQGPKERKLKRFKILGREGNTTVVLMMVDYLFETIERLLPYENKDRLSRSAISWREGCSDRLRTRIRDKAEAMKQADYATDGEQAYCTALAIKRVSEIEEAGNYDFLNGAGAWARKLARDAEWAANAEARMVQYRAEAVLAELKKQAELAAETTAQKRKREREEQEAAEKSDKWWAREQAKQARKEAREFASRDHNAYAEGERVGRNINLDSQLNPGRKADGLNG